MSARAKMIDKELENRLAVITWTEVLEAINALNANERDLVISDIKNKDGSIYQVLSKQIRQTLRSSVVTDIDVIIASGSVPIAFLNRIID